MLVVLCENLLEICLSYVLGESKLNFFVGQILNSRIAFILGRREYMTTGVCLLSCVYEQVPL